ncbi:MAG: hypothetical protein JWP88_274, partial [Flaviaesturariibacter sp.]|nr:hypothetical protein [Flaviaesturariibacter sp.]
MTYFFGMKAAVIALCLLSLIACSDDGTNPTSHKDSVLRLDTLPLHKEAVNPYVPVDISPMDISYFPTDYPVAKMGNEDMQPPLVRVIYSRPHRQGRKIFGELLKYGEPWRLGANEATEIEFFSPATIQRKTIPKGRYILYCIPRQKTWTICFNTNIYSWGLKHDEKKDVQQFTIPVTNTAQPVEYFTLLFKKSATGADMIMTWDEVEA